MKTLASLLILLFSSSVFAGPTVRVAIYAEGEAAGLVVQAYRACLSSDVDRDVFAKLRIRSDQPTDNEGSQ